MANVRRRDTHQGHMKTLVFPGQGSQFAGMGEGLFERFPHLAASADEIMGLSMTRLCLEDPHRQLGLTQFTQPALYVASALAWNAWQEDVPEMPAFFAGHSLGEYTALYAAGVLSFEDGLRLVKRRGELMARATGGGMAAVVGLTSDLVRAAVSAPPLQDLDVANYNSPVQTVISGPREALARAEEVLSAKGATVIMLPVSGAFHSRYMAPYLPDLAEALRGMDFKPSRVPVIANATARPYGPGDMPELLKQQLCKPVRWTESVHHALDQGTTEFIELGSGKVLTKLIEATRRAASSRSAAPAQAEGAALAAAAPGESSDGLGSARFRRRFGLRRAYVAGSLHHGISSPELVARLARAGALGCLGVQGLAVAQAEGLIARAMALAGRDRSFCVGVPAGTNQPALEDAIASICIRHSVPALEVRAEAPSPALARFRLQDLAARSATTGPRLVLVKVNSLDAAERFMRPAPAWLTARLVEQRAISPEDAALASHWPMADAVCIEPSARGGEAAPCLSLLPVALARRAALARELRSAADVSIGLGGGLGDPAAVAAAFALGAEFVLLGSVHLRSAEAALPSSLKARLRSLDLTDIALAPDPDAYESGGRIEIVRAGGAFPAWAMRLREVWESHAHWNEVEPGLRRKLEREAFGCSFDEALSHARAYFAAQAPDEIERSERDGRHRMALVFRWAQYRALQSTLSTDQPANPHLRCSAALGSFNHWWPTQDRADADLPHADAIAEAMMDGAARVLRNLQDRLCQSEVASPLCRASDRVAQELATATSDLGD
jgi:trans-AT polyketide synthase/acyltransferase/oxidoreductase domain-containing protein